MRRRPAASVGALRRPAAAGAAEPPRVRRRPAGAEAEAAEEGEQPPVAGEEEILQQYQRGEQVVAFKVKPGGFSKGDWVVSSAATYFHQGISLAAKVGREEIDGGERELLCELTGTKSEELLKYATSQRPCQIRLHLCRPECTKLREGPDLVHIHSLKKVRSEDPKTWETNLMEVHETDNLRREEAEWRRRQEEKKEARQEKSSSSSRAKKKKKKKQKKKKKTEKEKGEDQETPEVRMTERKGAAKKPLASLYKGTGLDPDLKARRRLFRKVRKALKKSADTSSSASSSSSSSSQDLGTEGEALLQDRSKVHRISVLAPGLLAAQTVSNMKPYLSQLSGTGWETNEALLPPLLSLYNRMYLNPKLSGGISREAATLAWIGDLLLQGRVSESMDCLVQRLKSIELTAGGTAWTTSQKLELVPPPEAMIGTRQELQIARREAKLDSEAKGTFVSADKGKGKSKDRGGKGKEKGKGKAKEGEGKKSS